MEDILYKNIPTVGNRFFNKSVYIMYIIYITYVLKNQLMTFINAH